ncbi:MAG: hypothetical protein ACE5FT_05260 [Candidatus Nanoarchaeia archaeon]
MIPKIRRSINDSYVGQAINHSIPGILVEGASREISDIAKDVKLSAKFKVIEFVGERDFWTGIKLAGATFLEALTGNYILPENHYSHTSPLFEESHGVFHRVPVQDALVKKVAEYSPKKAIALGLALGGYKPN